MQAGFHRNCGRRAVIGRSYLVTTMLAVAALLNLDRVTEFLYFNF